MPNRSRPIVTPLGTFPSIAAAAVAHGITRQAAHHAVHRSYRGWYFVDGSPPNPAYRSNGTPTKMSDDHRAAISAGMLRWHATHRSPLLGRTGASHHRSKKVLAADGTAYSSAREAAKAIGVNYDTMIKWIARNRNGWMYVP